MRIGRLEYVAAVVLVSAFANTVLPALAQVASPSAAPASSAAPLKEIGRVRVTTPFCRELLAKASGAIAIENDNDARLSAAFYTLAHVDLDSSPIAKHRGTVDLTERFVELRKAAVDGNEIMRDFRERAKGASDPSQRDALITFANALDGALHRQKTLADDLGRLIAYLDAHEPLSKEDHDELVFEAIRAQGDARSPLTAFDPRAFGPTAGVPDMLSTTAKNASVDLQQRAEPIAEDETTAAARIDPAFSRC
jgi:hypothetical protein